MERFRNLIAPVAQLVTVLTLLVGVAIWGIRLQDKVERLETQVQALLTSAPNQNSSGEAGSAKPMTNSLFSACANLAERAASAMEGGSNIASGNIKQLMSELGCMVKK